MADRLGSSWFVPPLLGVSCLLGRGHGCWCWKLLYAVSISLGPGIVCPAFVAHARRYAWKIQLAGHCRSERNGAWRALHWAMTLICGGLMYTMLMVAPTRRRVSTLPARCRWKSVCVATSGRC